MDVVLISKFSLDSINWNYCGAVTYTGSSVIRYLRLFFLVFGLTFIFVLTFVSTYSMIGGPSSMISFDFGFNLNPDTLSNKYIGGSLTKTKIFLLLLVFLTKKSAQALRRKFSSGSRGGRFFID